MREGERASNTATIHPHTSESDSSAWRGQDDTRHSMWRAPGYCNRADQERLHSLETPGSSKVSGRPSDFEHRKG